MAYTALKVDNQPVEIADEELEQLGSQITGAVILPGEDAYDQSRAIWNAMINRNPAFIVQCRTTGDIVAAVQFAKRHRLILSVRGAGHNIAGRALKDRVMLIDLSLMRSVEMNTADNTVEVEPGATLGDLDAVTQQRGRAVPVGINSTTGVSGLTLGGGFGWLSRKYGMTVDSLVAATVVTVEGEELHCSEKEHPELFWALRGGGGNYGIVSSFTFRTHPVGPDVMSGPVVYPLAEGKSVLKKYREFCANAPDEVSVWAVIRHAPPFPFLDPEYHGKPVVVLVGCYTGDLEKGEKALAPIQTFGTVLGHNVTPHKFAEFQQAFDPLLTPGVRNYWKSHNFLSIDDGLIDLLVEFGESLPSGGSEIFLAQMGGQTNRVAADETSYPHRDVEFIMNVHTRWEDPIDDDTCVTWAREFYAATRPFATGGVYVNFVSDGDGDLEQAYAHNNARLSEVKAEYDPENVLRVNLNILPA